MPTDGHLAVGFGPSAHTFDMVLFKSFLEQPTVEDCFIDASSTQFIDKQQDWITEIVDFGSRRNKLFKAKRALDTGDIEDFIFQLDREMAVGFSFSKQTTVYNKHEFTQTEPLLLLSDG